MELVISINVTNKEQLTIMFHQQEVQRMASKVLLPDLVLSHLKINNP